MQKRPFIQGSSDWDAIGQLKKELDIPVFANGDIKSVEDAIKCLEITKADGVSIGRGIMGDLRFLSGLNIILERVKLLKNRLWMKK